MEEKLKDLKGVIGTYSTEASKSIAELYQRLRDKSKNNLKLMKGIVSLLILVDSIPVNNSYDGSSFVYDEGSDMTGFDDKTCHHFVLLRGAHYVTWLIMNKILTLVRLVENTDSMENVVNVAKVFKSIKSLLSSLKSDVGGDDFDDFEAGVDSARRAEIENLLSLNSDFQEKISSLQSELDLVLSEKKSLSDEFSSLKESVSRRQSVDRQKVISGTDDIVKILGMECFLDGDEEEPTQNNSAGVRVDEGEVNWLRKELGVAHEMKIQVEKQLASQHEEHVNQLQQLEQRLQQSNLELLSYQQKSQALESLQQRMDFLQSENRRLEETIRVNEKTPTKDSEPLNLQQVSSTQTSNSFQREIPEVVIPEDTLDDDLKNLLDDLNPPEENQHKESPEQPAINRSLSETAFKGWIEGMKEQEKDNTRLSDVVVGQSRTNPPAKQNQGTQLEVIKSIEGMRKSLFEGSVEVKVMAEGESFLMKLPLGATLAGEAAHIASKRHPAILKKRARSAVEVEYGLFFWSGGEIYSTNAQCQLAKYGLKDGDEIELRVVELKGFRKTGSSDWVMVSVKITIDSGETSLKLRMKSDKDTISDVIRKASMRATVVNQEEWAVRFEGRWIEPGIALSHLLAESNNADSLVVELSQRPWVGPGAVFGLNPHCLEFSYGEDPNGLNVPKALFLLKVGLYANEALTILGLFRLPGSQSTIRSFRHSLNMGWSLNPTKDDIHSLTSLIKTWFRELPVRLLDPHRHLFPKQTSMTPEDLTNQIPDPDRSLFLWLIDLLQETARYRDSNKMTSTDLSSIFAPCVVSCPSRSPQDIDVLENTATFLYNYIAPQTGEEIEMPPRFDRLELGNMIGN